jgi:hypothetical protein
LQVDLSDAGSEKSVERPVSTVKIVPQPMFVGPGGDFVAKRVEAPRLPAIQPRVDFSEDYDALDAAFAELPPDNSLAASANLRSAFAM